MEKFSDIYRVRAYEAGPDARVRASVLCDYMQEAAGIHADSLGVGVAELLGGGLTWVLARFQVRFAAFPGVGEEITVRTWPSGVERLQCRRDLELRDAAGKVVADAVSWWVVVDTSAKKVVRIPESIIAIHPLENEYSMTIPPTRLPALGEPAGETAFPVRLADIDMNGHVNNVHYIQWAIESARSQMCSQMNCQTGNGLARPSYLEIAFKAECFHGDTVLARTGPMPGRDSASLSLLVRRDPEGNEREAARAMTVWE